MYDGIDVSIVGIYYTIGCPKFVKNIVNQALKLLDTTISRRKCTNPSDLVSQATKSPVSTVVGDHTGILGVVFLLFPKKYKVFCLKCNTNNHNLNIKRFFVLSVIETIIN
jgi:hypothetical protein